MKNKPDPLESAVEDYIDYIVQERSLSAATADSYRRDLRAFGLYLREEGVKKPKEVCYEHILGYLAQLRKEKRANSTIARRMSAIRGWNKFLLSNMDIDTDPSSNMHAPQPKQPLPSVLNRADTEKLLAAPDINTALGLRDKAMLEFLYGCGLRVSELAGLTVHDINREEALLRCLGKGSKERIIPIGEFALNALDAYLLDSRPKLLRGKMTQQLFLNRLGNKLSRSGVWRIVEGYGKRLGLKDLHPHTLRHSAATHMLDNGADLRIIQEFLGHSSISTTQIYTNLSKTELKGAYLRFHPRYKDKARGQRREK